MNKYRFNIEEILNREVIVEAESLDEACNIVNKLYRDEEIVLDYADFTECNITYIDKKISKLERKAFSHKDP